MKPSVLIWGAGGHALVVAEILRAEGRSSVCGYIDEVSPERAGEAFGGARVLGGLPELTERSNAEFTHVLPGVGDGLVRLRMIEVIDRGGFAFATAIHPSSVVASDAVIAPGCVVCPGAIVGVAAKLGRTVIVNTAASVDHHCVLEDGVHIAPGARLGGNVSVGLAAWIGIGAVVREGVCIGAHAIVGAGAVVLHDVAPGDVVVGNPARFLKRNPRATHPT